MDGTSDTVVADPRRGEASGRAAVFAAPPSPGSHIAALPRRERPAPQPENPMVDLLNILIALVSIGFGAIGWAAPRYTMRQLDLAPAGQSTMGHGEMRAASGALFVGLGLGALLIGNPTAFAMIGCAWGGAAIGRLTSILLDGASRPKWIFFAVEIAVGVLAIVINH